MLSAKKNKKFDAVKMMREIRDNLSKKYQEKPELEEKDLRGKLDNILSDQKRIGDIISKHTKISQREIAKLFREAQTKDVGYAIDKGIIHEIREVEIPTGYPVFSLVFKR